MSSNKTKMAEIAKETLKRIAGIGIFCIMVMQIAYREQIDTTEISATIVDEKDDLEYGELGIEPLIIEKVLSTNIKVSEATETETEEITQETVLETSEEEMQTQDVVEEITTQETVLETSEEEVQTQDVVEEITTQINTDVNTYTDEDLYWLSHIIMAEGEGASYEYKVCVGLVIMNRVHSPQFPNTIYDVIYSPNQYGSVTNGRINLEPNEDSVRAAREILSGTAEYSVPEDVVFQSGDENEGSGKWKEIDGDYFNYSNYR